MTDRTPWPLWLVPVLAIALVATWWWPSSDDAVVSAPIPPVAFAPAPEVAPAPSPVIAPTLIPAAAKPVDAAQAASALKLVGTVVGAGGADSFALVQRTTDSQIVRLRTGDRVEGLTVGAIEPNSVALAGAAQSIVIEADKTATVPASSVPYRPYRAIPLPPEPEPAWAGDPAPFGH